MVADFDPDITPALFMSTSGSTGSSKIAICTHKNYAVALPYLWNRWVQFPTPFKMALLISPLQWLSAIMFFFLSTPIFKFTRLQTSIPTTPEHIFQLINTYKPSYAILSPTIATTLLKPEYRGLCDFTCFDTIMMGGSAVNSEVVNALKKMTPKTDVLNGYGMTEVSGFALQPDSINPISPGRPIAHFQYRIVDPQTGKDVCSPLVQGELWLKGPSIFQAYLKNSAATAEAFAEDGWLKTGDLFYVDDNHNFFYVDRIKMMLKYKSYQISPVEVENVIRGVRGVADVCVTAVPDPECGDLLIACVVPAGPTTPTAQEIKDYVKASLSDAKQLRGGVVFMDHLPLTPPGKVNRRKLKEMVLTAKRE